MQRNREMMKWKYSYFVVPLHPKKIHRRKSEQALKYWLLLAVLTDICIYNTLAPPVMGLIVGYLRLYVYERDNVIDDSDTI